MLLYGNRGLYNYRSNGELLAAVWVDKRANYFLSTIHPSLFGMLDIAELPADAEPPTVKRRIDGSQVDFSCPQLLPNYQSNLEGK